MTFRTCIIAAAALCAAHGASAGDLENVDTGWYLQAGPAALAFDEGAELSTGGTVIPGANADLSNNFSFALGVGYNFTPEFSIIGIIGVPPTTEITGRGVIDGLSAGEVTYGPAIVAANYHFRQFGKFQPFVGAGATYTLVVDDKDGAIQNLQVENAVGGVLRAGFDYMVTDNSGIFMSVQKLFVDTKITGTVNPAIPGFGGAPIEAKVDLDPLVFHAGYTYRF